MTNLHDYFLKFERKEVIMAVFGMFVCTVTPGERHSSCRPTFSVTTCVYYIIKESCITVAKYYKMRRDLYIYHDAESWRKKTSSKS